MKKKKSSRKSQKTTSNMSRLEMKSSTKDNSSSIAWNMFSENLKTSNSSIVEPSNKVKNSLNNSNPIKASRYSWMFKQKIHDQFGEKRFHKWIIPKT